VDKELHTSNIGDAKHSNGPGLDDAALVWQQGSGAGKRTLMGGDLAVRQVALLVIRMARLLCRRIDG